MAREKICGIYCIRNIFNGKRYVGQAINVYDRWSHHENKLNRNKHENVHLQNAWNKYGKENFEFIILEYCCNDVDILTEKEDFWMNEYQTRKKQFGYNEKGAGKKGRHSEETKRKMSESAMDKLFSDIHKKHISDNHADVSGENNPMFNKNHSDNAKQKIGYGNLGTKSGKFGKKSKNATSKYFGVNFVKKGDRHWRAIISINKKYKHIGLFSIEEDAARAYDEYVLQNKLNRPINFPK